MIKDNTIYFGYGTVAVCSLYNHMILQEIKPPQEVGASLERTLEDGSRELVDVEYVGIKKELYFKSYEQIKEFENLLNTHVNLQRNCNRRLEYGGLVLDFTNWNIKSYEVMKIHIERIKKHLVMLMAC